jgi:hypothetical protein
LFLFFKKEILFLLTPSHKTGVRGDHAACQYAPRYKPGDDVIIALDGNRVVNMQPQQ